MSKRYELLKDIEGPQWSDRTERLEYFAALMSEIFHYGNFKAETPNERIAESLLIRFGYWPTTENEIIKRHNSQSIPAGEGTANDVGFDFTKEDQQYLSKKMNEQLGTANETINEETVEGTIAKMRSWKDFVKIGEHHIPNPVLDRQDKKIEERMDFKTDGNMGMYFPKGKLNPEPQKFTEEDLKKAFDNAHLMKGDRYVYNTFDDYKNKNL